MSQFDQEKPDHASPADAPKRMRICVDLEGETAAQFEAMRHRRHLSKSQAIRRTVALLAIVDEDRYEIVLRDKEGREPDRSIVLVP